MDIVQASFQASFDSRVDRLGDVDLDDLRVVFRYFDTDGDGAVTADQACRMFALLGLDVNTAQVRELGEVYLNEFIKIVDSHVQVPPFVASEVPDAQILDLSVEEAERKLRDEKTLDDEWKLLDTYRRGRVSMQELRLFLANCHSTLSLDDTERFLETYGNTLENDGAEELELTKEGFIKFRREYTSKIISLSDYDSSSDDDEGDLVGNAGTKEQQAPDDSAPSEANPAANHTVSKRLQSRHAERGPSDNSSDHILSSREHELVVNPDELVESDESDEEAATNNQNMLPMAVTQQSK
ncbi:EF-hand domain pair [Phytophthora cactorum]|nr:EF-hand domain pair [Phytophthora cactorum]